MWGRGSGAFLLFNPSRQHFAHHIARASSDVTGSRETRVVSLRITRRPVPVSKRALAGAIGICSAAIALLSPGPTQNAVANGDTRTLYLYHAHTHENIQATFMVDGRYDQSVLE